MTSPEYKVAVYNYIILKMLEWFFQAEYENRHEGSRWYNLEEKGKVDIGSALLAFYQRRNHFDTDTLKLIPHYVSKAATNPIRMFEIFDSFKPTKLGYEENDISHVIQSFVEPSLEFRKEASAILFSHFFHVDKAHTPGRDPSGHAGELFRLKPQWTVAELFSNPTGITGKEGRYPFYPRTELCATLYRCNKILELCIDNGEYTQLKNDMLIVDDALNQVVLRSGYSRGVSILSQPYPLHGESYLYPTYKQFQDNHVDLKTNSRGQHYIDPIALIEEKRINKYLP